MDIKKVTLCWIVLAFTGHIYAQTMQSEFLFEKAPFAACHASTIIDCKGDLLAAWFGGTHEKHKDVGIWISKKSNGKWSDPIEVVNGIQHTDKRYPTWNPVLMRRTPDRIILFYKVGPSPSTWWGEMVTSMDCGESWGSPCRLPEDILGPVKNKAVILRDGTLLCPSSTEHDGWKVQVELSKNWGMDWQLIGPLKADGDIQAIQPTVLQHPNGHLQMLCRTKKSGIAEAWSDDQGLTWTLLKQSTLPNPNSGIDGVTTSSGEHYLVYNPTSTPAGKWGGERYPLVLAKSSDGVEWQEVVTLESEPGEYSYPAIIQGEDGDLHITYTWKRDRIKHVVIDL
ncbi:MAG: exo-alpha-sialidase [Saprospiraceae bacterium]|nr:exo-alpha-sialidase [Saprospiraceae bacterium]